MSQHSRVTRIAYGRHTISRVILGLPYGIEMIESTYVKLLELHG